MSWESATVLTLTEFDVCWEALDLGEMPWQLDPPSPGRTHDERRRIVAATLDGLRDRGLAGPLGPRTDLADRLRVLAAPDQSLDVRLRARALVTGVGARRGHRAVIAVRHDGEIALLDVRAAEVPAALAELAGPITPGPGVAVRLPARVLDAARAAAPAEPDRFVLELVRHGVPDDDAHAMVRMCDGAGGVGQFGASARSRDGRLRRAPYVLGMHRTPAGHYSQLRRDGVVTIAPLHRHGLLAGLGELAAAA